MPARLRCKTMHPDWACATCVSADRSVVLFAGTSKFSCTTTVAVLLYWLCGIEKRLTEIGQDDRIPFANLPDTLPAAMLHVFHTPSHKFAILVVDNAACLLHSNQDEWTPGSKRFTLGHYLKHPTVFTVLELRSLLTSLRGCLDSGEACRNAFRLWFGAAWPLGMSEDYWFASFSLASID